MLDLAVYVHFPWCLQRCPYCDFATQAERVERIPHRAYAEAVRREIELRVEGLSVHEGVRATTLFFGGGTPSLWSLEGIGEVCAAVRAFGDPREVTVECNPSSLDRDRAAGLRDAGVTRLSIGVQSLRDPLLRYLGRLHDADGAVRALEGAVSAGGLRVSADLMFGMDKQSVEDLREDLARVVDTGVEHLSCYSLTIEEGTRFGELTRKGKLPRLADDAVAEMYLSVEEYLGALGFGHYEVSNYALAGRESEHNRAYWRGEAYLGVGAGAVGCVPLASPEGHSLRWRNVFDVPGYISALERGSLPPQETEELDPDTRVREGLMLGLRTDEGVALTSLGSRVGRSPRVGREAAIAREVARGNVTDEGDTLRIPRARWLHGDGITARLF